MIRLAGATLAAIALSAPPPPAASRTATTLDLSYVRLESGAPRPVHLNPEDRFVLLYMGASWCGPCRVFEPRLASAYPALRAHGIEVVFVGDEGCTASREYAVQLRMPWLLLPCDPSRTARLRLLGGRALPGLVLIKRDGRVLTTSWRGGGDSAPKQMLNALLETATDASHPVFH